MPKPIDESLPAHGVVLAAAGLALALVVALYVYATGGHVAFTTDSLLYRDLGMHLLSGEYRHVDNVSAETPESLLMVKWPPLYPGLWAGAAAATGNSMDAVLPWLEASLLCVTTLLMFAAGLVLTGNPVIAAGLALFNAFLPSTQLLFAHAWSETLFMPLTVAAFLLLCRYVEKPQKVGSLVSSALLLALANWTRHSGMVFVPLLGASVLLFSGLPARQRLYHALLAVGVSTLLAAPLWLQNLQQTASIFGGSRGGPPDPARLLDDLRLFADLTSKSVFAFDTVLEAFLRLPVAVVTLLALVLVLKRHGTALLRDRRVLLAALWAAACLLSLLGARLAQKQVDFDLRMLAIMSPFAVLALGPMVSAAFRSRQVIGLQVLLLLFAGLVAYSGLSLAHRMRAERIAGLDARWPSTFASHFQDMSRDSRLSARMRTALADTPPTQLVLTDQRGLYLRYLGWPRSYEVASDEDCSRWVGTHATGVIVILGGAPNVASARACVARHQGWRVIPVGGDAG